MSKETITIKDFNLFVEAIKPVTKITTAAKISVDQFGAKICSKNESCRCEIKTNSIISDNPVSIVVSDIGNFVKIMSSVESIHSGDFTNVSMFVEGNYLKVESKKFKTKFAMTDEEKIQNSVDAGFKGDLASFPSDYSFITNSNYIKRLNNHTFMFSNTNTIRVYIKGEAEMNGNTVYATIGDENNDFENSVTFEFGMLTSGSLGDSKIIMDFNGVNTLNIINSDEITVKKPSGRNSLFTFVNKTGKNGTFMNMTLVSMILVK